MNLPLQIQKHNVNGFLHPDNSNSTPPNQQCSDHSEPSGIAECNGICSTCNATFACRDQRKCQLDWPAMFCLIFFPKKSYSRVSHTFVHNVPQVPTCFACSRAYVPLCFCYVPAFIFLLALHAFNFFTWLTRLYLFACLTCAHFFTCLTCLHFFNCHTCTYFLYVPYMPPFFSCFTCHHFFTCLTCLHYFMCLHF